MTDNVLLHLGEEPRFDAIQTADIKPALQTAIAEARAQIAEVKAQTHTELPNGVPNNLIPFVTQTAMGIRKRTNYLRQ